MSHPRRLPRTRLPRWLRWVRRYGLRSGEYRKVSFRLTIPDHSDLTGPLATSITFMTHNQ